LDPRDPGLAARLYQLAAGLYLARDYETSLATAQRVIRSYPDYPPIHRWLAASLGQLGRSAEAKEALENALTIAPATFDLYVRQRAPWMRPEDHAYLLEGLRKAGLPEK
jgi:adenylate cyclase